MILVALDRYVSQKVHQVAFSGIYYLTAYTSRLLPYFSGLQTEWMYSRERVNEKLTYSVSNYDRDGFIVYCSKQKILI